MTIDRARLKIYSERLCAICEEMGETLKRSAESPNIKTRKDYSCAIVVQSNGRDPEVAAQAAHIPVHLGSLDLSVKACLKLNPSEEQMILLNDPYNGGTHLPDLTVTAKTSKNIWVVVRAHHADVGGKRPGSMGDTQHIDEEGYRLEPTFLTDKISESFCNASRTPEERKGDLFAQVAAVKRGLHGLEKLAADFDLTHVLNLLLDDAETAFVQRISQIPEIHSIAEDHLESSGKLIPIKVRVANKNSQNPQLIFDFTGSAGPDQGSLNAPLAVTRSAVLYVLQSLFTPLDILPTSAPLRRIEIIAPEGCVFNAKYPSAVSGGNVETSQRAVDLLLNALQPFMPDDIPAGSQSTMNNVTIGGSNWAYYETIAGGMGAGPSRDGATAIQVHMTNTLNTHAEELETVYPLRIIEHSVRKNSGGLGRHRGGDGVIKIYEVLKKCEVTIMANRRLTSPPGSHGGEDGRPGRDVIVRVDSGRAEPICNAAKLNPGDIIRIETPGGGGWGSYSE